MKTKRTKKRKKPQDSTMRNVRAANKRIKKLEDKFIILEAFVKHLLKHTHC